MPEDEDPEEPEEIPSDWDLPPSLEEPSEVGVNDEGEPGLDPVPPSASPPDADQVSGLMDYLEDLTQFLPEDKKQQLVEDSLPLKMQKIRHTLGQSDSPEPTFWPVKGEEASVTRQKLNEIMRRLKQKLAE